MWYISTTMLATPLNQNRPKYTKVVSGSINFEHFDRALTNRSFSLSDQKTTPRPESRVTIKRPDVQARTNALNQVSCC